ncbi:MAG: elongation factor G [Planctomycetota bacterium]|nr:elongation factor G [Planctomycetota bacterium]
MTPAGKIRNIGMIAHIDAGKTTFTERILFATGKEHKVGAVDKGTAKMDWMPEEQERGITITSAATTCAWKDGWINIIDTPGHVDFTAEVERSLRVLDGAIGIFDGVAGVQPQSETVWRQADRYDVPRIAIINKLDRVGADWENATKSLADKLGATPLPLQIPVGQSADFIGVIDLIHERALIFHNEGEPPWEGPIPDGLQKQANVWRERLIEKAAEVAEPLLEKYVRGEEILTDELIGAIRKGTLEGAFTPVLLGSALRGRGVQPLLDAVLDFLPSPADLGPVVGRHPDKDEEVRFKPLPEEPLSALAFKTASDAYGQLTYLRVYSGTIKSGMKVYNPRSRKTERIGLIIRMHADEREVVDDAGPGEIVGCVGLKRTVTGDSLCSRAKPIIFGELRFPEPVISMAVEPKVAADRDKLILALSRLGSDDPTFRTQTDEETSQLIMSGMGELHLDVMAVRLKREYGVGVRVGKPRVAYRQRIRSLVEVEGRCVRQTGGRGQYGVVKLRVEPDPEVKDVEFEVNLRGGAIPKEFVPAVREGVLSAASGGGIGWGYRIVQVRSTLLDGSFHDVDSSEIAFRTAGAMAFREAMVKGGIVLLEPWMRFEIDVPEQYLGAIVNDLAARRAEIQEMDLRGGVRWVRGIIPLREILGYTTVLRSLTQGRGLAQFEPMNYLPAPSDVIKAIS